MSKVVIKVEDISKKYRIGTIGAGTLKADIIQAIRGLGRSQKQHEAFVENQQKEFWALKNISFEVSEGEILGIIGDNGAGKSTLLKILSRITLPTKGRISGKGRIASLLEVGTGFHEELSGRENIFLNGNILGMKNFEIKAKFDQIVDFSGVEKFLDTPVKRYSSGMYVRLAFAIAAHLDPEILIVDEVLAVGDSEFQKKCLGKMRDISTAQGSTVILVSHNMQAVRSLCQTAIFLQSGKLLHHGLADKVINDYTKLNQTNQLGFNWGDLDNQPGNENIRIHSLELIPYYLEGSEVIDIRTAFDLQCIFENLRGEVNMTVGILLYTISGECIFDIASKEVTVSNGKICTRLYVPANFLNDGSYYFSIIFVKDTIDQLFLFEQCIYFDVEDYRENTLWFGKWMGAVRPDFPIDLYNL